MLRPTLIIVVGALCKWGVHAHQGAHESSLSKCVHQCEAFNACHSSLDAFSCEATCDTMCKCKAVTHRMLNKPKHCTASMLAKFQKKLSMLRKSKRLSKVTLKDDDDSSEPKFDGYIPLEEYFGKDDQAEPAKPRMLNAKHLSMLKTAEPWSRAAGRHFTHRHHKARKVAAMAQTMNIPKPETKKEEKKPATQSSAVADKKAKDEKFPWWNNATAHLNFTAQKPEKPQKASPATSVHAGSLTKASAALGGATAGVKKDLLKPPSAKDAPKAPTPKATEKASAPKAPTPKTAKK